MNDTRLLEKYRERVDALEAAHKASIVHDGALREDFPPALRITALMPFLLALEDLRALRIADQDGTVLE